MATFSALEISMLAGRVATSTANIHNNVNNASGNAKTVADLIRSSGDSSANQLAAEWDALSNAFTACGNVIEDCGDKMRLALDKYASNTQTNETTAAQETSQVSQEIESLGDFFK